MATLTSLPSQGQDKASQKGQAVTRIPFVHAAHEHLEPAFDKTLTMGTSSQEYGPFDVPAYGYIRNIWLLVEMSGGALGSGVLSEDAPFNALQNVSLEDVNGAPIIGPVDGYELFLINKWGGYSFYEDPENKPDYNATYATIAFAVRIPVEIAAGSALGCLSNMNAAATYKVRCTLAALSTFLSTVGTATGNAVRLRGYLEAWSLPQNSSRDGVVQAVQPPLLGTTQYWSKFVKSVSVGENTIGLPRVGNQIRSLIAIYRNATPVRNDTNYPDPIRLQLDGRIVFNEPAKYRRALLSERWQRTTRATKDTGIYVYGFHHDVAAHPGAEDDGHLWLRTLQATRLELVGTFGAAGTLTVLTNDVAPVAVTDRFAEENATVGTGGSR